jgi:pSer/pThr/pTyr-binding forkhead associated (FHA) protein
VTTTPADTPSVTATQEVVPSIPVTAAVDFRPARLILKRFGALTKDEIPMQGAKLVVGRFDASSGPVEIDLTGIAGAENISRRHAEMTFENNVWKVRDLGSTNGVFVKRAGQEAYSPRVVEPTAIHDGDELAFGNIIMVFKEG